ncbi:MAG: MFS transporter [Vicinamibacteria bacterium]
MDLGPLRRHRDYRLLFAAQSVSFFGSLFTYVALPYQIYRLTGSSLAVGLAGLAELGPLLLTVFVGGALADAVDRRRMVLWTEAALAVGSLGLAVNATLRAPLLWPLYVAAAVMSALNGLQRPSLDSLMPRLVDKDEVPAAAALSMVRGGIGMIVGPALGGALIASSGVAVTYAADFATYVFSFLAVGMIRHLPPPEGAESPSLAAIREGFRYAGSRQELIGSYVVDFVAMVFGMPIALFPAIADKMGGPRVLGMLYAAPAVGGLAASVMGRFVPRVRRHGLAIALAATAWGLAIVVFGFCERLWPAVVFLALAGGADAVSGLFRMTLWNQTIPDVLRGRLASIEIVSYTSGPLLGHAEAGLAAALGGVRFSVVSGGALCVVGVAICAALLPDFVRYKAPEVERRPELRA